MLASTIKMLKIKDVVYSHVYMSLYYAIIIYNLLFFHSLHVYVGCYVTVDL